MLTETNTTSTLLRRQTRGRIKPVDRRDQVADMISEGCTGRALYRAGEKDAGREAHAVKNLGDVLLLLREAGLGRASVIQQSNSHVVVKVHECTTCETSGPDACLYLAGYFASALKMSGRPDSLWVRELSCGEFPGHTCIFAASW